MEHGCAAEMNNGAEKKKNDVTRREMRRKGRGKSFIVVETFPSGFELGFDPKAWEPLRDQALVVVHIDAASFELGFDLETRGLAYYQSFIVVERQLACFEMSLCFHFSSSYLICLIWLLSRVKLFKVGHLL